MFAHFSVENCKSARIAAMRVSRGNNRGRGIGTALESIMPTDFLSLLRRDHSDLQHELTQLVDPGASAVDVRMALDGVRLGLIAHAEAEDIVLGRFEAIPALQVLVAQARAAHLTQEATLSALVRARPLTTSWIERALQLRELLEYHATQEEAYLMPALRTYAPSEMFAQLAGAFATERMRQLAMLQPSGPVMVPDLIENGAW
jgi:hypothetical protein